MAVLIRVTRDGTPAEAISVDYATADGSANASSDYAQTTGTATFAANETAKVIHIPIIDDLVDEPNEEFTFTISNGQGGTVDSGNSTATITILDNDAPTDTIQIERNSYSINETGGSSSLSDAIGARDRLGDGKLLRPRP